MKKKVRLEKFRDELAIVLPWSASGVSGRIHPKSAKQIGYMLWQPSCNCTGAVSLSQEGKGSRMNPFDIGGERSSAVEHRAVDASKPVQQRRAPKSTAAKTAPFMWLP